MTATARESPSTSLSVVIPAYEELPNLRELLPRLLSTLDDVPGLEAEVIVVLPRIASEDEIREVEELGARAVIRSPTDSFGDAIRTGIDSTSASSSLVATMDADGSHDPSGIPRMLAVAASADVVVASRYTAGGRTENAFLLKGMSRLLNVAYGMILRIDCRDISTNFKLYRRDDVYQLQLGCTDFDIVEEIIFRIRQKHGDAFRVVEIPDHFYERKHGVTKRRLGPFTISYIATLLRLRWEGKRPAR